MRDQGGSRNRKNNWDCEGGLGFVKESVPLESPLTFESIVHRA